jgi:proliferating cell nuclear antigen
MHLTIENKSKQEVFVALFQLLKNWGSYVSMHFESNRLYIQSMDKSHVCLADIDIKASWFAEYECKHDTTIAVDSTHIAVLMNYALKHDSIKLLLDDDGKLEQDKLMIHFLNGKEKKNVFDHFFELPLVDVEQDSLGIPQVEYDVDFTIESKKWVDVLSELNTFGQNLNIRCNEEIIELNASGDSAKLKVNIPIDDLNEYSIAEGEEFNLSFSLNHLCKMCSSTKLGSTIDISLSSEFPMLLKYDLGDDSKVAFYVAPKISDA